MRLTVTLTTIALATVAAGAQVPDEPPSCPTPAWTAMPIASAATAARAPRLALDAEAMATLRPTPKVRYALRPEKPGGSVSYGGLLTFEIAEAGRYRVGIGSAAWIDVVRDGRALGSVAHGPGPRCAAIRKTVAFDLVPGRYLLQIAGNGTAALAVQVSHGS